VALSSASLMALACPIPEPAPVTIATRSWTRPLLDIVSSLFSKKKTALSHD